MNVKVDDPDGMISSIYLHSATDRSIIYIIDMAYRGKRAVASGVGYANQANYISERGPYGCDITFEDIPFERNMVISTDASRYTAVVTILNIMGSNKETVYENLNLPEISDE